MNLEQTAALSVLDDESAGTHITRTVLGTPAEFRTHLQNVIRAMEHRLVISSATLSGDLFQNTAFIESLKRTVLTHRFTRVRILTGREVDGGDTHALLLLARSLPGLIQVRHVDERLLQLDEFAVADEKAVLYRIHNQSWNGMVELQNVGVARFYLERFENVWIATDEITPELMI